MRFDFIALVVAAAFLACLETLSGVSGFPMTNVDSPNPAKGRHDVAFVNRILGAARSKYSEKRSMICLIFDIFKAVVNSIWLSMPRIHFKLRKQSVQLNEEELSKVLIDGIISSKFSSVKTQLRSYRSKCTVDILASALQKMKESEDTAIRKRATDLLNQLLLRWAKQKKTIEKVAISLKLFDLPPGPDEGDFRKMEVLRSYIKHLHPNEDSNPILLETFEAGYSPIDLVKILERSSAHDGAKNLLEYVMETWKKAKLSADGFFAGQEFGKMGMRIFDSIELSLVERYAKGPKAKHYLNALLVRWKEQKIDPVKLLDTKFTKMNPTEDKRMMQFIETRYRELYKGDKTR